MDMRFHWIRDRIRQGHFRVYWKPGTDNLADFFTKDHPIKHQRAMRHFFVSDHAPSLALTQPSKPTTVAAFPASGMNRRRRAARQLQRTSEQV
jgi:hypothetical protein